MIIKCPNCGGALEYNIEQKNLFCKFCGSFYTPEEVDLPPAEAQEEETPTDNETGPDWLFDADYKDSMVIASRVKSGKHTATHYYRVNTDCKLYYYPVDASQILNDKTSKKLEPYDYSGMCPFSPVYMSGFYADRFDIPADTMIMTSMYRAQKQMYGYARKSVPGSPSGYADTAPIECENIGRVD